MNTLPIALAAAALAVGLASTAQAAPTLPLPSPPSLMQKAGCYDECEEFMEAVEEAREEAYEAAAEAAVEAAEEAEEYGYRPRRASRRDRALPPARMVEKPAVGTAPTSRSGKEASPTTSAKTTDIAVNVSGGCKQYFPATGITLSVPCE